MAQGITSSSRDTIDWWKATNQLSNSNWSGIKNLQPLNKQNKNGSSNQDSWINKLSDSHFSHNFSSQGVSIQNNASAIIDKLKKEIGELTDEQKYNMSMRSLFGNVSLELFTESKLRESLVGHGRVLLSIYQVQNKSYRSHIGFCLISQNDNDQLILIQKFYLARFIRKHHNYRVVVNEVIKYLVSYGKQVQRIKLKVNSS